MGALLSHSKIAYYEEAGYQIPTWLRAVPGVEWLTVHVSNGNNAGPFYEKYGFHYTHDVAMGFIKTYVLKV